MCLLFSLSCDVWLGLCRTSARAQLWTWPKSCTALVPFFPSLYLKVAIIAENIGTGMVSEQLVGTALPESLISHLAYNETNIFRQRTIGSPARDYVPLLCAWDRMFYSIASTFGIRYGRNEKEEAAKEYRRLQQIYINDLLANLRIRINNGDETPSILGNIMRSGNIKDEEILLASYTGSMYHQHSFTDHKFIYNLYFQLQPVSILGIHSHGLSVTSLTTPRFVVNFDLNNDHRLRLLS